MNAIATPEPTITRVSRRRVNVGGYIGGWPRARTHESWKTLFPIGFYLESLEVKNFILLIDFTEKPMFPRVWVFGMFGHPPNPPAYATRLFQTLVIIGSGGNQINASNAPGSPLHRRRVGGLGAYTSGGIRALSATTGVMGRMLA